MASLRNYASSIIISSTIMVLETKSSSSASQEVSLARYMSRLRSHCPHTGAYTARALASFICQIGLLSPGMMDYFAEIFNAYKRRDRKTEKDFKHMRWAQEYVRPGELG